MNSGRIVEVITQIVEAAVFGLPDLLINMGHIAKHIAITAQ